MMTLDDIYGITLGEYLELHRKTKEDLVRELEIDIDIIENNYKNIVLKNINNLTIDDCLKASRIKDYSNKKKKHLQRVKDWNN